MTVFPTITTLQIEGAWFNCSPQASTCEFLDDGDGAPRSGTLTGDAYTHDELTYLDEAGDLIPDRWTPRAP